jgi:HD-GYP domain-containing protein (c-di-GMP phosphodiesterase class II)
MARIFTQQNLTRHETERRRTESTTKWGAGPNWLAHCGSWLPSPIAISVVMVAAAPREAAEQLVSLAANLNAHDRRTRGHTERVRAYSVIIG